MCQIDFLVDEISNLPDKEFLETLANLIFVQQTQEFDQKISSVRLKEVITRLEKIFLMRMDKVNNQPARNASMLNDFVMAVELSAIDKTPPVDSFNTVIYYSYATDILDSMGNFAIA